MYAYLALLCTLFPTLLFAQLKVDTKAPELKIEHPYQQDNTQQMPSLAALAGQVVVLDFWATWCTPCVKGFPKLNELTQQFSSQGVSFIAICNDSEEKLQNFLAEMETDFLVGRDVDNTTFLNYQIQAIPQIYVINREGTIVYAGHSITEEIIAEVVQSDRVTSNSLEKPPSTSISQAPTSTIPEVITHGGFGPGGDPVVYGMQIMMAQANGQTDFTPIHPVYEFTIRPSLEKEFGGHSWKTTQDGYVGITYSSGTLSELLAFLKQTSSPHRIKNNTGNSGRYDLIYWKKSEQLTAAFAEIEEQLLDNLSLSLQETDTLQNVRVAMLAADQGSRKPIATQKEGTQHLLHPVQSYLDLLENISGIFHVAEPDLAKQYLTAQHETWTRKDQATYEQVQQFLAEFGIQLTTKEQKTRLYTLSSAGGGAR